MFGDNSIWPWKTMSNHVGPQPTSADFVQPQCTNSGQRKLQQTESKSIISGTTYHTCMPSDPGRPWKSSEELTILGLSSWEFIRAQFQFYWLIWWVIICSDLVQPKTTCAIEVHTDAGGPSVMRLYELRRARRQSTPIFAAGKLQKILKELIGARQTSANPVKLRQTSDSLGQPQCT